ncbi:helix-turn-helix domain-containing protein [Bacteroides ovatus]|uniref:helix-turn-helix domain-containing protein n=1 Tax=Bacteroides ovatus TaxID=28116 RepID=UPI0018A05FB5|nr:helix-turn-helix domain-containing protein [Bacteroides ovatus]MDC2661268.1 helix-turn-helix domain-containing protein [Bacteroides ovatus]
MEIVTIEKKTFEEMRKKLNQFSEHLQELCSRYRPPEKMNWLDNADVCEKLNVSKRTLQTYRDRGLLAYSQINHKLYYRLEDVEAFLTAMSKEIIEEE